MVQESISDDALSEVFNQLTVGIATLTADGTVMSWNPEAAGLTGYSLLEINAIGLSHIFDTPDAVGRLLQQAARGSTPILGEHLIMKRADGRRASIDVRCSPLRHIEQAQGRYIVVMRDLSEIEALQNRLLQSERLSLLGRLAGSVSHEIRNPLAAIFLHVNILEDELRQLDSTRCDQIDRSLTAIKAEVSRLHELVQQYLSLARLPELHGEPVDLVSYLEAFDAEMQPYLSSRGMTWRLEGNDDLGWVSLHQNSFRRGLLNLVHNAIEAMPQGGVLTLRCRRLLDQVHIELCDSGCGISADQLPLLFQPLHTTKPEGTGLGLYLAREIIQAHQGDIAVVSEPGVGTTFTISLPLHSAKSVSPGQRGERMSPDGHDSDCG